MSRDFRGIFHPGAAYSPYWLTFRAPKAASSPITKASCSGLQRTVTIVPLDTGPMAAAGPMRAEKGVW